MEGLASPAEKLRIRVRNQLRRAINGSESTPLRDRLEAELSKPHRSRSRDEWTYTLGLLNTGLTLWLFAAAPRSFWMWYAIWAVPLLVWRWYTYTRKKWQYFMLDYCYSVNVLCGLHLFVFPRSSTLFEVTFMSANGPLAFAIIAWRNSLVFHDLERISSLFIHIMPPLLMFCQRWYPDLIGAPRPAYLDGDGASFLTHMLLPLGFYAFWQLAYFWKTEVLDKHKLEADPALETSLRWMTRRPEGPVYHMALRIAQAIGYVRPNEQLTEGSSKLKVLFMATQFMYTVVTLLPTKLMFHNMYIHLAFLLYWSIAATYNGATYYFEVFARRYLHEIGEMANAMAKEEAQRLQTAAFAAIDAGSRPRGTDSTGYSTARDGCNSSSDDRTPASGAAGATEGAGAVPVPGNTRKPKDS